jgi:hypothetical protein
MRIYALKHGSMTEQDREAIAAKLLKAGYTVRIGRNRDAGKTSGPYTYYVEYFDPQEFDLHEKEKK